MRPYCQKNEEIRVKVLVCCRFGCVLSMFVFVVLGCFFWKLVLVWCLGVWVLYSHVVCGLLCVFLLGFLLGCILLWWSFVYCFCICCGGCVGCFFVFGVVFVGSSFWGFGVFMYVFIVFVGFFVVLYFFCLFCVCCC